MVAIHQIPFQPSGTPWARSGVLICNHTAWISLELNCLVSSWTVVNRNIQTILRQKCSTAQVHAGGRTTPFFYHMNDSYPPLSLAHYFIDFCCFFLLFECLDRNLNRQSFVALCLCKLYHIHLILHMAASTCSFNLLKTQNCHAVFRKASTCTFCKFHGWSKFLIL